MSEKPIKFQYQKGIIADIYSFSANNNVITLSEYIEKLENAKIREAIQYEAKIARALYVDEVNRLKREGKKVNTFLIKREASKMAKKEAQAVYTDIWGEVERIYANPPPIPVATATGNTKIIHLKNIEFFIAVTEEDLFNKLTETIENHYEATRKVVDSP